MPARRGSLLAGIEQGDWQLTLEKIRTHRCAAAQTSRANFSTGEGGVDNPDYRLAITIPSAESQSFDAFTVSLAGRRGIDMNVDRGMISNQLASRRMLHNSSMRHQPRKRFGQNFLHDQAVIERIVNAIDPRQDQHLVEIGPGQGAITSRLIGRCSRLDVIELDRDLIPLLRAAGESQAYRVHNGDALRFDYCSLAGRGEQLRLLGNLPYNISTPLLFHLLGQAQCIRDLHFMLQKEVVERIVALPGSKRYGRLSVAVQARCRCEMLFTIGPGAFTPPPKVDSAIVRLVPDPGVMAAIRHPRLLDVVLQEAFGQRRKTILNALKRRVDAPMLESVAIAPGTRAEMIPVDSYVRLANLIGKHGEQP